MAHAENAGKPQSNKEWFEDGLRFECTLCGACCTGPPGYVAFTRAEAEAIASAIGVSVDALYRDYAHELPGVGWSLRELKTKHGLDCVFLDRASQPGKAVCSVHSVRPAQCRTWPFWPENIENERAWRRTAKSCEGIGQGDFVPVEAIRIQRDATPRV